MSTDHLTATTPAPAHLAEAVLAVLSGTPVTVAATAINTPPADLADAVELYQSAGREALETHVAGRGWYQVNVEFPGTADAAAAALGQRLDRLHDLVDAWWFIRKQPGLRLRLRLRAASIAMRAAVNAALNDLAISGVISCWGPAIYEPETAAFGGPAGMDIAHDLFCADSRHIVTYLQQPAPGVGRKEVSMLFDGHRHPAPRRSRHQGHVPPGLALPDPDVAVVAGPAMVRGPGR